MRPRFAWVTNVDAPYRRPVWRALGKQADLTVWLTDPSVDRDAAANRGADWATKAGDGYDVRRLPSIRVQRGEARYYLPRTAGGAVLRHVDAVLLGGWESPVYWLLAARARLAGVRRVGFYESHRLSRRYTGGVVATARSAWFRSLDAVLVPGEAAADALRADGVNPARIVIGFNAVDVHHFAAAATSRTESAAHRFLVVSQLIPRKQIDLVVAALASLPGATLTVAGSGPERGSLEQLAVRFGVADRTRFLGSVPQADLPAVYAAADTLVLPSAEEVWGLVVNEALAAGLGVVVSSTAGVAPSVTHMAGVQRVDPTGPGVLDGMRAAVAAWSGPIAEPAILAHTPEAFAADAFRALTGER
jgi:glycosyltransferase involved in cell wall biosynthesis